MGSKIHTVSLENYQKFGKEKLLKKLQKDLINEGKKPVKLNI
jgi:hypothetical protein